MVTRHTKKAELSNIACTRYRGLQMCGEFLFSSAVLRRTCAVGGMMDIMHCLKKLLKDDTPETIHYWIPTQ